MHERAYTTPETEQRIPGHTVTERMTDSRPAVRLYIDDREVDVPEDPPETADAGRRVLVALLTGREPGTRGRVDALAYPSRRGAHAYRAEARYEVNEDGEPRVVTV